MEEKFSTRIYPAIIIATFLMSLAALCRTYERKLDIDYIGIIIGILALLVTALIGWQVLQAILIEDKIKQIAETKAKDTATSISEALARKVSEETTVSVSKNIAEEAMKTTINDFNLAIEGRSLLLSSESFMTIEEYCKRIDEIFKVIDLYNKIENNVIYETHTIAAIQLLSAVFAKCQGTGGARILEGRQDFYEFVLQNLRIPLPKSLSDYLDAATPVPPNTDYKLREEIAEKEASSFLNQIHLKQPPHR